MKQFRIEDKLGSQGFHYDTNQLVEPITKTLTDTSQKLLDKTKINTKSKENLE